MAKGSVRVVLAQCLTRMRMTFYNSVAGKVFASEAITITITVSYRFVCLCLFVHHPPDVSRSKWLRESSPVRVFGLSAIWWQAFVARQRGSGRETRRWFRNMDAVPKGDDGHVVQLLNVKVHPSIHAAGMACLLFCFCRQHSDLIVRLNFRWYT